MPPNPPVIKAAIADGPVRKQSGASATLGFTMVGALANNVETWTNAAAHIAGVVAIIVGGWWTYNRFIRVREKWPRATLDQHVTHRRLDRRNILLRLDLRIHNAGEVLLQLRKVRAEAYQVLPLADSAEKALSTGALISEGECEADWPCLGDYEREWDEGEVEIEPQEADELGFDFVIPADMESLFIYCYVWNASKNEREIGWPSSMIYDVIGDSGERTVSSRELTGRS